ncbi:MAG: hypothetical protein WEB60_03635 [Terrimicrobiaceae bacterium]
MNLTFTGLAFVRACGTDLQARVEESRHPDRIDHVWITMHCGFSPRILVSVNTWSLRNHEEGFDGRVRIATVSGTCDYFPARGILPMEAFDYEEVASSQNLFFEHKTRLEAENLLLDLCQRAELLEAWGMHYHQRKSPGIHQIHSRRASCAVADDHRGKDGGLKFYGKNPEGIWWVMVLTKFCGQP